MLNCLSVENAGSIGNVLKSVTAFLFGKSGYIFAVFLILFGIILIAVKEKGTIKRIIITMVLVIMVFGMLFAIIDKQLLENVFSRELFSYGYSAKKGGGFLGTLFASFSVKLFSLTGTYILMVFLGLISVVLVTQKSIYEHFIHGRDKINTQKEMLQAKNHEKSVKLAQSAALQEDKKVKILDYSEIRPKNIQGKEESAAISGLMSEESKQKEIKFSGGKFGNIKADPETGEILDEIKTHKPNQKSEKSMKPNDKSSAEVEISIAAADPLKADYQFPSLSLLDNVSNEGSSSNKKEVMANARLLEKTLADFGIKAKISEVSVGPSVTRYELQPEPGVKVSRIVNLSNDLALSLATSDVRIEAPIPGKAAIGIEVPNKNTDVVHIREIIESSVFAGSKSKISFALGKKLSGSAVVADISKMPHMLIAGATGSGKSVCINSIIISILYKASPEEVKLILIDPKMVELNNYNGIPHLLIPVVTDPKHAAGALNWAIREMTERYKSFKNAGVRDIIRYNEVTKEKNGLAMPRIVIIIDELADLMMVSPREVENSICRLAQLARAAGIHLVLATQRPSVDVITGLIKANIPSRVSFAVSSMMDSRTILDMGGAEKLLGRGDMLFYPVGEPKPMRIQGTYISDKEVENVVEFVKKNAQAEYSEKVIEEIKEVNAPQDDDFEDDMLPKAIEIALEAGSVSTSHLQRRLRVGYSRAGRLIDEMEQRGIISGPEGSKPRKVLVDRADLAPPEETAE
ncbi:MAG: DNA translocase FtsK [Eubacteriaceae bacterium]|nr:DNA translocase FtsK [Eubacteriaceae bacterium]